MSNINPYNIDGTYPVAGQDNNSQGFRDNFTNIRNNLGFAKTELEDLQAKVVLKSALTINGSLNNNMGGAIISGAQLQASTQTVFDQGTQSGTVSLIYSNAAVQKFTTGGSATLSFSGWPTSGQMASMTVWIYISSAAHTITVPTTSPGVTIGLMDIAGANTATGVITFDQIGTYLLEFSTVDAGSNIFITDLSRNKSTLRDPALYYNDNIASTMFVGYNATSILAATAAGSARSAISAFGSYTSVTVGNLSTANTTQANIDTGIISGYNMATARGNLQTGTVSPVQINDYLGFHNVVAMTGNGSGNAFQQTSTIAFYATGANVTYGLGGNIAFYTKQDGVGRGAQTVYQALGLENDQSARMYGNLFLGTGGATSTYVPASSSSRGSAGQVAWDSTYFYICTSTNTWKRVQLNLTSW
jgi:hypothetical protein